MLRMLDAARNYVEHQKRVQKYPWMQYFSGFSLRKTSSQADFTEMILNCLEEGKRMDESVVRIYGYDIGIWNNWINGPRVLDSLKDVPCRVLLPKDDTNAFHTLHNNLRNSNNIIEVAEMPVGVGFMSMGLGSYFWDTTRPTIFEPERTTGVPYRSFRIVSENDHSSTRLEGLNRYFDNQLEIAANSSEA